MEDIRLLDIYLQAIIVIVVHVCFDLKKIIIKKKKCQENNESIFENHRVFK